MKFIRNAWYGAIWGDDLGRSLVARRYLNEPVVLYRKADGTPVALADRCPHRFAPLSMGILQNDEIECLYHGLRFDCSGRCTDNPNGTGAIPKAAKVRHYPLAERWGMVWIWMGDPDAANPDLIPDLHWMTDSENHTSTHGYIKLNANYLLVNDNLTDLSHASFVHVKTLAPREMAREPFKISEENGAVWARLFYSGMETPAFFKEVPGMPDKVDRWLEMRCDVPGTMVTFDDAAPVGRPREEGWRTANPNITTPETDQTTHYFWGSTRSFCRDDKDLTAKLRVVVALAFNEEDKPILEGQQAIVGEDDLMNLAPVFLANDGGSVRARRLIEQRIVEEAAGEYRAVEVAPGG